MTDADLRDLVRKRRDASVRPDGEQARARKEALSFYEGKNDAIYGDSGDGLSTVVSRDTFEAVESILPGLIKPFVAGDEAVRFEPTGPEDEDGAKQATEYIGYLFANHNSAFRVVYDYAKDGLLYRLGVAKVVHEAVEETDIETLQGLTVEQYDALDMLVRDDKTAEIVDDPELDDGGITVRVKRQKSRSTYRVHVIAPDEFVYEQRLASLEDATFLGQETTKPVGDLIAMGLDKDKCKDLQGTRPPSIEADERHGYEAEPENLDDDDLARQVWIGEYYIRVDYDGTGSLQWRRVITGGSEEKVLLNEPAEDHPYVPWTPIPIPHKLVGMSAHDTVRDIQMTKTALIREAMNASYLANRPMREVGERALVNGGKTLDSLLSPAVGGVIPVKEVGQIREIPNGGAAVAGQALQIVEYFDTVREQRTGSTRYNQGMDANSLNKTATGVSIIQNASVQRLEMISRQLAEAMMGIFRKMLGLVSRHADKQEIIRLRGEWVEMDPREWKTGYDMSVAVGLGTGNKDQTVAHLTNLLNIDREIIQMQGGLNGPLLFAPNLHEKLKRMVEAMGMKGTELYYTDPSAQPEGGDQPAAAEEPPADPMQDPTVIKARIDADTKLEIARMNAEKDIIIAQLRVPPQFQDPDGAPPQGAPEEPNAYEGTDYPPQFEEGPQEPLSGGYGVLPEDQDDYPVPGAVA